MKILISLMVLLTAGCCLSVRAQTSDQWVEVSPGDELFRVLMPRQVALINQKAAYGAITVNGKAYAASVDGASYIVWSLVKTDFPTPPFRDSSAYLDACVDLVRESLLKSIRDKLPEGEKEGARMTYRSEVSDGPLPGREYLIAIGSVTGVTRIYIENARIYVLVVLGPPGKWKAEPFFKSFTLKPGLPVAATLDADPSLVPPDTRDTPHRSGEETDYNRVFAPGETTQKVRILSQAKPRYTESARKYVVAGTVVLRAILTKDGQVLDIKIVKRLPHGLTEQALAAARSIKFTAALKDGHAVSQYVQLEYNFFLD